MEGACCKIISANPADFSANPFSIKAAG